MEKPILATTLSGLFLKQEAWNKAHVLWYRESARKLGDNSVLKWIDKPDYFKGVDEVMKRLYPELSDSERTKKARKMFFDSVIRYIRENPHVKNEEIIKYFKSLKNKFRLALITTNTQEALNKILSATGLESLFDIIETSGESEKDDKILVFQRFIEKYGKPQVYIGGDRKESFDFCKKQEIKCIYANLEREKEIEGVKSVHNLHEIELSIESLS